MLATLFFYGFGPSIPSPLKTVWKHTDTIMKGKHNVIYSTIIWVGRATGTVLLTYGVILFVVCIGIITAIYSEHECIESLRRTSTSTNATNATDAPTLVAKAASISLVSISQLLGGGTAPGTVHSQTTICSITSICVSVLNIGIRSLLFAVGLACLTEVEPEMTFSSKLCICMRNGTPTLLCRFGLVGSDCAVVEHCSGIITCFLRTHEGEHMTESVHFQLKCFPHCASPITASHSIDSASVFQQYLDILPNGTCVANANWNENSKVIVSVVCYDTVLERTVRRSRVFSFQDILIGHQYKGVMDRGGLTSANTFQVPINQMSRMHQTVVQGVFSNKEKKEEKNEERRERGEGVQEEVRGKETSNTDRQEKKQEEEQEDEQEDEGVIYNAHLLNGSIASTATPSTTQSFDGRTEHRSGRTIACSTKAKQNATLLTLEELELWPWCERVTKFELMFLVGEFLSFVEQCSL